MITFEKLWKTMKEKNVTQYKLIKDYNISPSQITRLKRNQNVNTYTISRLCQILNCRVEDICEYIPDEKSLY